MANPSPSSRDHLRGGTIKVVVGDSLLRQPTFIVHKYLLCSKSPFFEAACKEEWREGRTGTVALPNDDPNIFTLLLEIMYAGELLASEEYTAEQLIDLYIFADKVQMITSANMAFNALHTFLQGNYLTTVAVEKVYAGTARGSRLRKLIVDESVRENYIQRRYSEERVQKQHELLLEISVAYSEGGSAAATSRWGKGLDEYCD